MLATSLTAILTKGSDYLRSDRDGIEPPMHDEHGNPSGDALTCVVTGV
ncbi:hypothetical protein [Nocardia aurantiaca]|uniref:Uncharacterized protein n=1 Tax=Nocardia aurantiaca TaxID=2675850 RepID=A0A6I3L727_9NOCA|nr:hypothetical protein [Nocardia aurantiaca]MTE16494.1 hypothetical protein [Nocardia aurantiaca]